MSDNYPRPPEYSHLTDSIVYMVITSYERDDYTRENELVFETFNLAVEWTEKENPDVEHGFSYPRKFSWGKDAGGQDVVYEIVQLAFVKDQS